MFPRPEWPPLDAACTLDAMTPKEIELAAKRIAYNQRLRNDAAWAGLRERRERRKVKRQIIVGVLAWGIVYVLALRGRPFSPIYEIVGRISIAGAVLLYVAPYLEWLLFPKDRKVKSPAPWDPEKAYTASGPRHDSPSTI
jgi:hypothetical protein